MENRKRENNLIQGLQLSLSNRLLLFTTLCALQKSVFTKESWCREKGAFSFIVKIFFVKTS